MAAAYTAVDLFAGAGGTTEGLKAAGFSVLAAVENDADASDTYEANHPEVRLYRRDIRRVQAPAFGRRLATRGRLDLLTACPPCQGFSTLGDADPDDPRNDLVATVSRFVDKLDPRAVLLENVPGLATDRRLVRLMGLLEERYEVRKYLVNAVEFGVPQNRRRIIVLAIERGDDVALPDELADALPASFSRQAATAGDALAQTEALTETLDPIHRGRRLRELTVERIRVVPQGGGRADLPPELRLACHDRLETRSATSIYGRIHPARPAPTMTTRCTTPSCGRFVHPYEHRGLTLREAAVLQTFRLDYRFKGLYGSIERQIGNAVPVRLAEGLGLVVSGLLGAERLASAA